MCVNIFYFSVRSASQNLTKLLNIRIICTPSWSGQELFITSLYVCILLCMRVCPRLCVWRGDCKDLYTIIKMIESKLIKWLCFHWRQSYSHSTNASSGPHFFLVNFDILLPLMRIFLPLLLSLSLFRPYLSLFLSLSVIFAFSRIRVSSLFLYILLVEAVRQFIGGRRDNRKISLLTSWTSL